MLDKGLSEKCQQCSIRFPKTLFFPSTVHKIGAFKNLMSKLDFSNFTL